VGDIINKVVKETVNTFKSRLHKDFGERLIDIIIYGSVVRGGFNENSSDIDFLVIIQGGLSVNDMKLITKLHLKYRQSNTLLRLLEGRYIGIQNDNFINGYYLGTNQNGWKPINDLGFGSIESAMILDAYDSVFYKDTIVNLLHVSWDQIVKEIRNQVDEFLSNDLIGINETYTRYALVTASRSLYTFKEYGFISKNEAIKWMKERHFELDFSNPIHVLTKIKNIITVNNEVT
jgi:predicted nucleotidyltransferase